MCFVRSFPEDSEKSRPGARDNNQNIKSADRMGADQRKHSFGCFSWFSSSKQSRAFVDDKEKTRVVKAAPSDSGQRFSGVNSENSMRLSESGRSRASSSQLHKRVSFSEDANPSKSFSNMSSLKATGPRKYPSRLDLQDENFPYSQPSDALVKTASRSSRELNLGSARSSRELSIESNSKIIEGSAHKLVEDVVDKLASTIHSTLFPQQPEPRYVLRSKDQNDEDLYLL